MTTRSSHREIPVKVTAWVDEGVAPLVRALNDFDRVMTVDSCEGKRAVGAYVLFRFRGSSRQAARFAADLGAQLGEDAPPYLLQAEWRPGGGPLLALSCPLDSVEPLAEALSGVRRTQFPDGTPHTGPRSSRGSRPLPAT